MVTKGHEPVLRKTRLCLILAGTAILITCIQGKGSCQVKNFHFQRSDVNYTQGILQDIPNNVHVNEQSCKRACRMVKDCVAFQLSLTVGCQLLNHAGQHGLTSQPGWVVYCKYKLHIILQIKCIIINAMFGVNDYI